MKKYFIIWQHRHGVDIIFFKTERVFRFDDEIAWRILEELDHNPEPDRDEYIEMFGEVPDDNHYEELYV